MLKMVHGVFWIIVLCTLVGFYYPIIFLILVVAAISGFHRFFVAHKTSNISRGSGKRSD